MEFPPVGPPVTVTAQRNSRLAFRDSSTICWIDAQRDLRCRAAQGLEKIEQTGPFAALAIDPYRGAHGCALRDDGTIACFGFEGAPLALCDPSSMWPCIGGGEPPSGHYIAISAGYGFSCAVAESGAISCWGDDSQNQASTPPAGTDFVGLTSAHEGSCAWTKTGEVQCWGFVSPAPEPSGPVKQLILGSASINSCWLLESALVHCDAFSIPDGTPFENDSLARIGAGNSGVCALDASGQVKCAGNRFLTRTKPPLGPFLEVETLRGAACGLRGDDVVECWGDGWGNGSGSEVCGVSETRLATDAAAARVLHGEWRPLGWDQTTDTWRFETGFYEGSAPDVTPAGEGDVAALGFAYMEGPSGITIGSPLHMALAQGMRAEVGRSLWALDATQSRLGEMYCTAPGSDSAIEGNADELSVVLHAGKATCPGTPVSGDLSYCICSEADTTHGSIDGIAWTTTPESPGGAGYSAFKDGSYVAYAIGPHAEITWGLLFTSAQSPYGEQVFCVGRGSLDDNGNVILEDLSRMAPCTANGTTLRGCTR